MASFFSMAKPLPRSELPPLRTSYLETNANHNVGDGPIESIVSKEKSCNSAPKIADATEFVRSPMFWTIFAVGLALVIIQGVGAYIDGYFSQAQILEVHSISNAYAFIEHGGIWADVFITTPLVAYIATSYHLPYLQRSGIWVLATAVVVSLAAGIHYQEIGKIIPEAHTHLGHTPLTGWIHGLYAVAVIWICGMFYLTDVSPQPGNDIVTISIGFTVLFILGVVKFNPNWSWSMEALVQVAASIALLWIIAAYKFGRHLERGRSTRHANR